jgi:hypothetical protein
MQLIGDPALFNPSSSMKEFNSAISQYKIMKDDFVSINFFFLYLPVPELDALPQTKDFLCIFCCSYSSPLSRTTTGLYAA